MEVVLVQSLTLIGLFLSMVFFSLLPLKLVRNAAAKATNGLPGKYEKLVSLANCLSAGVFLATFFVGLLPEVRQDLNQILEEANVKSSLPVTEVIVLFGFFLAMFVEQIALTLRDGHHNRDSERMDTNGARVAAQSRSLERRLLDDDLRPSPHHAVEFGNPMVEEPLGDSDDRMVDEEYVNGSYTSFNSKAPRPGSEASAHQSHGHGHSHGVEALLQSSSVLRFGILLLSLGVHSLFEGMALGLQTEVHTLMNLFVGVWIHECLIAFALGFSMAKLELSVCHLCQIAIMFSSMIPVGQIIGIVVGCGKSWTGRILNTILQAVAAGTFIQITFLDVLPEGIGELPNQNWVLKMLLLFAGFLAIAVITFFVQLNEHL